MEIVSLQPESFVNIRWHKKNPVTKSYIWTVRVLQLGHEDFCEKWLSKASVQIEDAEGNKTFVPIVPCYDPDLTVYEDIDQVLISGNVSSQRAKRKLQMPSDSQELRNTGLVPNQNDAEVEGAGHEPIEVLNPEDVSKTFSDIREASFGQDEPNCSAINTSQVNEL